MNEKRGRKAKEPPPGNEFGRLVVDRMAEMGIRTQLELEALSGVSQARISDLIGKPHPNPSFNTVTKICKTLRIPVPYNGDFLDVKIILQLADLCQEDKTTLLRIILRLKNSPERTSEILRQILKAAP